MKSNSDDIFLFSLSFENQMYVLKKIKEMNMNIEISHNFKNSIIMNKIITEMIIIYSLNEKQILMQVTENF